MGQLCHDSGNHGHLQLMQFVSHAVVSHRVHHGVAEYHLSIVRHCRVVVKHRLDVGIKQPLDLGQCIDKLQCLPLRLTIHLVLRAHLLTVLTELEPMGNLLRQQRGQLVHMYADIVGADSLVGLPLIEVVGEDDALHQLHNLLHLLHRGQRSHRGGHHSHLLFSLFRQQRHIPAQRVVHYSLVHIVGKGSIIRIKYQIYWDIFEMKLPHNKKGHPKHISDALFCHLERPPPLSFRA